MTAEDGPRGIDWALTTLGVERVLNDPAYRRLLALRVQTLRTAGWSFPEIAEKTGVLKSTAQRLLGEAKNAPDPTDAEPARYDRRRLLDEYTAGMTPRELRDLHRVPLGAIFADLGAKLWSRDLVSGESAVERDRPEVVARIIDPDTRRPLAMRVKTDHQAGWSVAMMSTEYELTPATLERLVTAADIEILTRKHTGQTTANMAAELDIPRETIRAFIRSAGENAEAVAAVTPDHTAGLPGEDEPPEDLYVTDAVVTEYRKAMGRTLRVRRVGCNLSADQAADMLGVSTQGLYAHENGTREVTAESLLKYAALYRVRPDVLVAEAFEAVASVADRDTVTVNLAAIAASGRPELAPLRGWARLRQGDGGKTHIRVAATVLHQFADRAGIDRTRLIAALDDITNPGRKPNG